MDKMIQLGAFLMAYGPEMVSGVVMMLSGMIVVAMLIPGEQPEKALQGAVDFLKKFSAKKPE